MLGEDVEVARYVGLQPVQLAGRVGQVREKGGGVPRAVVAAQAARRRNAFLDGNDADRVFSVPPIRHPLPDGAIRRLAAEKYDETIGHSGLSDGRRCVGHGRRPSP